MEFWGKLVVFAAVAGAAISAEESVTFPEIARERTNTRIVSGWEATDGQFPFQFSLRMVAPDGGVSSCGGSIIHEEWGLTAAHCTAARESFVIRVGVVNLTLPDAIFETTEFYNYPLYDNNRPALVQPNDIGLIAFQRRIEFNSVVQPVRIQRSESRDVNVEGARLTASGWGRTWTSGSSPENLNWVYLSGTSNLLCRMQFGAIVENSTICARGYNDTTQSTCQGDSGGPLTKIDDDGIVSQIGVTSFVSGSGCHTDFPAGFVRPGYYHDFFFAVTGIDFDWKLEKESPEDGEWDPDCEDKEEEEEDGEEEEGNGDEEDGNGEEEGDTEEEEEGNGEEDEDVHSVHFVNN